MYDKIITAEKYNLAINGSSLLTKYSFDDGITSYYELSNSKYNLRFMTKIFSVIYRGH